MNIELKGCVPLMFKIFKKCDPESPLSLLKHNFALIIGFRKFKTIHASKC